MTLQRTIPLILTVLLVFVGSAAAASNRTKVNKRLISVSPPDANGMVTVHGSAGAISNPTDVAAKIINMLTKDEVTVELRPDGSFDELIRAAIGQDVRVIARKQRGNTSRGTVEVPPG